VGGSVACIHRMWRDDMSELDAQWRKIAVRSEPQRFHRVRPYFNDGIDPDRQPWWGSSPRPGILMKSIHTPSPKQARTRTSAAFTQRRGEIVVR